MEAATMEKPAQVDHSTEEGRRANPVPGLKGKALEVWIQTGKGAKEQAAEAKAAREQKEREAERQTRSTAAKKAGAKPPRKPSPYDDGIRIAAKRVREILDGKGAPGAKQILAVRKALGKKSAAEATGISATALKKYATKKQLTDANVKALREFAQQFGDPFCAGRRLAVILVALDEQK